MIANSYKNYTSLWTQSKAQQVLKIFLTFPLSILSRITPKGNHEIYGSMNGFKICDNSKFLFENTQLTKSFFITKNRELSYQKNDRIIYAYSLKGVYLQLRAKKIYWTHGLNDFIAPLVVGSYIVGLQHGLPGKKPMKLIKAPIYYKLKNIFIPYMNNDFCQEVWSPSSFYDTYIQEALYPLKIIIKRKQIPRIEFQPKIIKNKKILYAPSHRAFRSFIDVITSNKIFADNFISELNEKKIQFILRPHPIDYDELLASEINLPFDIDFTDDIHDTLSSYTAVISDFSGLLIDCWEMNIDTYCLCDDLEDIFERGMLFEWFFQRLKSIRIFDVSEIFQKIIFSDLPGESEN